MKGSQRRKRRRRSFIKMEWSLTCSRHCLARVILSSKLASSKMLKSICSTCLRRSKDWRKRLDSSNLMRSLSLSWRREYTVWNAITWNIQSPRLSSSLWLLQFLQTLRKALLLTLKPVSRDSLERSKCLTSSAKCATRKPQSPRLTD